MATPPVPPRPLESYEDRSKSGLPPPVPPLPPNFKPDVDSSQPAPLIPHYENPLIAPRPHRLQPDLPANMARQLTEQASQPGPPPHQSTYPAPPPVHHQESLSMPMPGQDYSRSQPPSAHPVDPGDWSPWNFGPGPGGPPPGSAPSFASPYSPYAQPPPLNVAKPQYSVDGSIDASFAAMSLNSQQYPPRSSSGYSRPLPSASPPRQLPQQPQHQHTQPQPRPVSQYQDAHPLSLSPGPARQHAPPSLTVALPTPAALSASLPSVQRPDYDPAQRIAWTKDVLSLVDRAHQVHSSANAPNVNSTDVPVGPVRIGDAQLQRLVDIAVPLILEISSPQPVPNPVPPYLAEAIYLRATCAASGAYPQYIQHNPRTAFRDFELAAKNGYHAAWFKLGRDYENFGDVGHARDCFDRGVKYGVESCLYRMGMAHLMGQLGLPSNTEAALPLLHRAATLATADVPQPAYVYALLLLSEFSHVQIPPRFFSPFLPPGTTPSTEARKHLERAAYLNFPPAQYKLGHSYEYATPPFPFDALLSVQYYSLASQQGEVEADMALSKWFLCGAEGAFEKDEGLAWTFADKAAKKGLSSAEFAMGYYAEVGVGGPKDIDSARRWYTRAAENGNADAKERLQALSQPTPQALSREQHQDLTNVNLVRKRTQAKQRSDTSGLTPHGAVSAVHTNQIMENVRKGSTMLPPIVEAPSSFVAPQAGPSSSQQPQQQQRQRQQPPPSSFGGPQTSSPPELGKPTRLPQVEETKRPPSWVVPVPGSQRPPQQHGAGPAAAQNSTSPRPQSYQARPSSSGTGATPGHPQHHHTQPQPQQQQPQSQQQQRPWADSPRYSLADPGSGSASGPPPTRPLSFTAPSSQPNAANTRPLRPNAGPGPGAPNTTAPGGPGGPGGGKFPPPSSDFGAPRPGFGGGGGGSKPPGPQSFAEMGIAGTKVKDDDCIVM